MLILDRQETPLIFEGTEVIATRIVYKDSRGKMRYPLIVYYITSELRSKYISCILSYYGYNKDDYEMPSLLKEIIELKEIPETAWNKYSIPERDILTNNQIKMVKNNKGSTLLYNYFTLKSGMYAPLAAKKDIFGTSPFIEVEYNVNLSVNYSRSNLIFNLGLVMPNDRKKLKYYYKGETIEPRASELIYFNVGYKYSYEVARNLFWDNYIKIGLNSLMTNKKLKEKKRKDDNDEYGIGVFNAGVGTHLRYRRFGIFVEYQYAPYEKSKHLRQEEIVLF